MSAGSLEVSSLTMLNPAATLTTVSLRSSGGGTTTVTTPAFLTSVIFFDGTPQFAPTDPPPGNGSSLTLNTAALLFDPAAINGANFSGGSSNVAGFAGGNGGTFTANTTGPIVVNTDIDASSGYNFVDSGVIGGAGGSVNLTASTDTVTVNSNIEASSDDTGAGFSRKSAGQAHGVLR